MSYISRSTRELRGNNRQRQGAKAGGKDMGQRHGAETWGRDRGAEN